MKKVNREVGDKNILDKFVEDFCEVIGKYAKYVIVSGFVAIAHGRTRTTEDIDLIFEKIPKEKFIELHNELIKKEFICMQSDNPEIIYDDYLIKGNSVRYVRKSIGMFPPEMEIKFPKDELDKEQLNERQILPFTKLNCYFSSIESNIAFKEEYLGSDKDFEDAKHLRKVCKDEIDNNKIEDIKAKIRKYKIKNGREN